MLSRKIELGEVATYINGKAFKPSEWSQKGLPIIRIQNLTNPDKEYNHFEGDLKEKYRVRNGDILISWSASLGVFEWGKGDAALNQHIFKVVFDKMDVDKSFFKYIIGKSLDSMSQYTHGATMKHITKKDFDRFQIPLPPLPIQRRIAAILDQADALRRKDAALLARYDALAQSVFLGMFGDPVRNEKGWEKVSLEEVTTKIGSGATPRGGKNAYKKEGISLIRSLNVHDLTFKYEDLAFIDDDQADKLKNVIVEEEDVLFNITGASVCRSCIVPSEILPARVNQHVAILRPKEERLLPIYLSYYLISPNIKKQLLDLARKGGATREAITKDDLQNYELLVPGIGLQRKFKEQIINIEQQKQLVLEQQKQSEALFQSLLQKAFKGELVSAETLDEIS